MFCLKLYDHRHVIGQVVKEHCEDMCKCRQTVEALEDGELQRAGIM